MSQANPTREDFAALLQESFAANDLAEGYVAKGIVTAIEKDVAIVDVGQFGAPSLVPGHGRDPGEGLPSAVFG